MFTAGVQKPHCSTDKYSLIQPDEMKTYWGARMDENNHLEINRNLHDLAPGFGASILHSLTEARRCGLSLGLFEGLRNAHRQAILYEQGRSRPGKIVTYAQSHLESWHGLGLAADIVFSTKDGSWTWDVEPEAWQLLHAIITDFDLHAPISWDKAHIQPRNIEVSPPPELQALMIDQGIRAVWMRTGHDRQSVDRFQDTRHSVTPF